MSVVQVTDSNLLPKHEKLIRDSLKQVLHNQEKLKGIAIHNTEWAAKGDFAPPYMYVKYLKRTLGKHSDIANFEYVYTYQIGVVTKFESLDEDKIDDRCIDLANIVETAISVNKQILGAVQLFHYSHEGDQQQYPYLSEFRHFFFRVGYTADVPLGS